MNDRVAFRFVEQEGLFHPLPEICSFRYTAGLFQRGEMSSAKIMQDAFSIPH